jgi:hypothetical protein
MDLKLVSLSIVLVFILLTACSEGENKKDFQAVESNNISELIRNPATFRGDLDTINIPVMSFEREVIFFDTVYEGTIIEESFKFTNTGKTPLWITDARATCGCTVPAYPRDPIPPGEGGEIKVRFNTADKYYLQDRPITIFANTYPGRIVLRLRGYVLPGDEEPG